MQVVPATQVPDPVHPMPAHCDHFASVPPEAADVVAAALEVVVFDVVEVVLLFVVLFDVESVVPVELLVVVVFEVLAEELLTTTPPGPATEVVSDPLST